MTNDNRVARDEEQVAPRHGDMSRKGGKGPTAASTADTPGAFGDLMRDDGQYIVADQPLNKGAIEVGGEMPAEKQP